ncbi:MAG: metallophosphoesterase, partial [Firmicutes bacterium]|nr:metallophosphoesterase [Bacillota bacterium]
MAIFAIGDLHLPGGQDKPMNVFGSRWDDHAAQIADRWKQA